jgi:GTP-binding protein
LLHLVDAAPMNESTDLEHEVRALWQELAGFSQQLAQQERWLILNKMDLLPADEQQQHAQELVAKLAWPGPVYTISALSGAGCGQLCADVMAHLQRQDEEALDADDAQARSDEHTETAQSDKSVECNPISDNGAATSPDHIDG